MFSVYFYINNSGKSRWLRLFHWNNLQRKQKARVFSPPFRSTKIRKSNSSFTRASDLSYQSFRASTTNDRREMSGILLISWWITEVAVISFLQWHSRLFLTTSVAKSSLKHGGKYQLHGGRMPDREEENDYPKGVQRDSARRKIWALQQGSL